MGKETKKTILIVEDDKDVLSSFVKNFKLYGYRVITAVDGMEGLKKIDAGGYDLVITDIIMPFVSGVGIVDTLKKQNPDIPIIAITGYGKEPETMAIEKDADVVLSKPVKMSILKNHLNNLLNVNMKKKSEE